MSPYPSSILNSWKCQDLNHHFSCCHSIFFFMFMGLNWRMHGINGPPFMLLDSISFNGHRMSSLPKTWAYYCSSVLMIVEGNSKNFRSHTQSHLDHSFPVKGNGPTYSLHLTYCKFCILNQNDANIMIVFPWMSVYVSQFNLFPLYPLRMMKKSFCNCQENIKAEKGTFQVMV